jgi:NADH-quinone oxidoreductase subunit L
MLGAVFGVLENKYKVDELYALLFIRPYMALARVVAEVVDWRFWHDWFHDRVLVAGFQGLAGLLAVQVDLGGIDRLANGIAAGTRRLADSLRRVQTGYVRTYALSLFLGVVLIVGYLIFR